MLVMLYVGHGLCRSWCMYVSHSFSYTVCGYNIHRLH